jgi:hypothetical protein
MAASRPRTLALGTWLAARGTVAGVGIVLAGLGALASAGVAVTLAGADSAFPAQLPLLESSAIAWSAGMLLAFGGALGALGRDRQQGVWALARARGASTGAYVRGRVGGLVLLLAATVGGATLVAGIAAISVAHPALAAARTGVAGLAYALAFSVTVGPLAMATLGGRTRVGGALALLAVLALPEILSPWSERLLPRGWHELTSIPAALDAVRSGVAAPAAMVLPMMRALAGLTAVLALSLVVVGARARHPSAPGAP